MRALLMFGLVMGVWAMPGTAEAQRAGNTATFCYCGVKLGPNATCEQCARACNDDVRLCRGSGTTPRTQKARPGRDTQRRAAVVGEAFGRELADALSAPPVRSYNRVEGRTEVIEKRSKHPKHKKAEKRLRKLRKKKPDPSRFFADLPPTRRVSARHRCDDVMAANEAALQWAQQEARKNADTVLAADLEAAFDSGFDMLGGRLLKAFNADEAEKAWNDSIAMANKILGSVEDIQRCLEQGNCGELLDKQNEQLAAWLASLAGDGIDKARERVDKAAHLLRTFVTRLTNHATRQIEAAVRCQR